MTQPALYVVAYVMVWQGQIVPGAVLGWMAHMGAQTLGAWRN